uniref:DNA 3'-5' helicase n=1 Tax=Trichobilharzia regenti TaxID=157069 RepID=A0AA85JKS7_TRIRE|nr:unnamed protein product [Trichobilharzia regenti]
MYYLSVVSSCAKLQQKLKSLKKHIDSITRQITELNNERQELQAEYDKLKSQLQTVRIQEISRDCQSASSEYASTKATPKIFPWTDEVNRVKKEIFGISEFRPLQITAINALLDGRDVILVMPTGAGKSLVYQLPALLNLDAFKVDGRCFGSVTLVISPLVSLMVDQSINLTKYGLEPDTIAVLDASTPLPEQRRILSLLAEKPLKSQLQTVRIQEISRDCQSASSEYASTKATPKIFPWTDEVNRVKKEIFGISEFRPLQITAINALLDGRDVILVMPTGAGKSLVYQLPALLNLDAFKVDGRCFGSVTLVISPLVSLMVDQSINLTKYGLEPDTIAVLDASTPLPEQRRILSLLAEKPVSWFFKIIIIPIKKRSRLRLLYVTPEKLAKSKLLLNRLELAYTTHRLACIAIDEVHCASQWGHDFRPDYKFLHVLRRQFPSVPIIGLTATASAQVIVDVQNMLGINIDKCLVLRTSYNRENLNYYLEKINALEKQFSDHLSNCTPSSRCTQRSIGCQVPPKSKPSGFLLSSPKHSVTISSDMSDVCSSSSSSSGAIQCLQRASTSVDEDTSKMSKKLEIQKCQAANSPSSQR